MKIKRFGSYYVNLDEFIYAQKFSAKVMPASAVRSRNVGGVSIGLESYELVIYEDEPGYKEFIEWLDSNE
jgi:hypothetical protein